MYVTVEIPDTLARSLGDLANRADCVFEAVIAEGYRAELLTRGQVAEALDLGFYETEEWLRSRRLPLAYGMEDLEDDRRTLDCLLADK